MTQPTHYLPTCDPALIRPQSDASPAKREPGAIQPERDRA